MPADPTPDPDNPCRANARACVLRLLSVILSFVALLVSTYCWGYIRGVNAMSGEAHQAIKAAHEAQRQAQRIMKELREDARPFAPPDLQTERNRLE